MFQHFQMLRTFLLRPSSPHHTGSQYALLLVPYPSKRIPPSSTPPKLSMRCISSGRNVLPTLASRGLLQVTGNIVCRSARQHWCLTFNRMSGPKEIYHPISWQPLLRRRWDYQLYSFLNLGITENIPLQPCGIYAGFDPTASSLHVGNLLILVGYRRIQEGIELNSGWIVTLPTSRPQGSCTSWGSNGAYWGPQWQEHWEARGGRGRWI